MTKGLDVEAGFEFSLLIRSCQEEEYIKVLEYLVNYVVNDKALIQSEQTIAYHSWLLKFITNSNYINIYEVRNDGQGFIEGADYAINTVKKQLETCKDQSTSTLFPTFSQMIVVSKGVIEGRELNAVRYPSAGHMTGWWLTTDLYNGNINSLETLHYYHVAFNRPDIIKWLALPFGFRFISGSKDKIWFDSEVLSS